MGARSSAGGVFVWWRGCRADDWAVGCRRRSLPSGWELAEVLADGKMGDWRAWRVWAHLDEVN